jgi:hypothetical protein
MALIFRGGEGLVVQLIVILASSGYAYSFICVLHLVNPCAGFHSTVAILTSHLDINWLYGLKRAANFDRVDRAIY